MHEFDLIKRYFAPLATSFSGSLNLTDDASVFAPPAGCELVITKDALVSGVHFIGNEAPALIAQKALRTNLSDLAGMGATPLCYLLALMLPRDKDEAFIADFARGLARDQAEFSVHLAGGDTVATTGPLSISITAIGTVPTGSALTRSGAKIGDEMYVSGTLGDSAAGLASLQKNLGLKTLEARYLLPQPRLTLGESLRSVANACMDISDGLAQDLGHICAASKVGAIIHAHQLPIHVDVTLEHALSGGDDYELLFTVPPVKGHLVPEGCTKIGHIMAGDSVKILDVNGSEMTLAKKGFSHF